MQKFRGNNQQAASSNQQAADDEYAICGLLITNRQRCASAGLLYESPLTLKWRGFEGDQEQ